MYKAKGVVYNTNNGVSQDVILTSVEDMAVALGNCKKENLCQIDIDKYHKICYNIGVLENSGISGWVKTDKFYDRVRGTWSEFNGKEFFTGDKILLFYCNNDNPVDITDKARDFIISHIERC